MLWIRSFSLQFCLVLACAVFPDASAKEIVGNVNRVIDGDTIELKHAAKMLKIRLTGIDAPESDQPFGQEATRYLSDLIIHQQVLVTYDRTDRYGRLLGKIILDETDINLALIRNGYAWWYRYYRDQQSAQDQMLYESAELEAKALKRGLWTMDNPINPYDWRNGRRGTSSERPDGCGSKRYCREMTSCEEARFYMEQCGLKRLDGDKDGIPCESICR